MDTGWWEHPSALISRVVGGLTKDVTAMDFSMRFQ
jgi:hypothetical protein